MDLEELLFEFTMEFSKADMQPKPGEDPSQVTIRLYRHIREFAKKHKQYPDLLTQYQEAIEREQYEVAHILKNKINEILENNGLRKGSKN